MKALLQRVSSASVTVDGETVGEIKNGLCILLGVGAEDDAADVKYLVDKTANLRIFEDEDGKLNRSILDCRGEALVISQFTLYADSRKGRRPSFSQAALPELAKKLYEEYADGLRSCGIHVETGIFQAEMTVAIHNEGPVTIMLESKEK